MAKKPRRRRSEAEVREIFKRRYHEGKKLSRHTGVPLFVGDASRTELFRKYGLPTPPRLEDLRYLGYEDPLTAAVNGRGPDVYWGAEISPGEYEAVAYWVPNVDEALAKWRERQERRGNPLYRLRVTAPSERRAVAQGRRFGRVIEVEGLGGDQWAVLVDQRRRLPNPGHQYVYRYEWEDGGHGYSPVLDVIDNEDVFRKFLRGLLHWVPEPHRSRTVDDIVNKVHDTGDYTARFADLAEELVDEGDATWEDLEDMDEDAALEVHLRRTNPHDEIKRRLLDLNPIPPLPVVKRDMHPTIIVGQVGVMAVFMYRGWEIELKKNVPDLWDIDLTPPPGDPRSKPEYLSSVSYQGALCVGKISVDLSQAMRDLGEEKRFLLSMWNAITKISRVQMGGMKRYPIPGLREPNRASVARQLEEQRLAYRKTYRTEDPTYAWWYGLSVQQRLRMIDDVLQYEYCMYGDDPRRWP